MQKHSLVFAAATALIVGAGLLWPVPGNAGSYYGPIAKGGKCWHSSFAVGIPGVGWWGECARSSPSLFGEPTGHGPFPTARGPGHSGGPRLGGRKMKALQNAAKT